MGVCSLHDMFGAVIVFNVEVLFPCIIRVLRLALNIYIAMCK